MTKPISTGVDLDRRDPDEFDPIAWWEGTGEDLGLPPGFLDDAEALKAKFVAKYHADVEAQDSKP